MKNWKMRNYIQICVLFHAMTMLYSASISHLLRRAPNPQLLEDAIKLINEGQNNSSFLYKLMTLESHSQGDSPKNISFTFVIKETVCLKSAEIAEEEEECPFKENGVMKNCTAKYSAARKDEAEVRCQTLDPPTPSVLLAISEDEGLKNSSQSYRKAKFVNSGKKNGTTFLDVSNKDLGGSHLSASCLLCIFDGLPKRSLNGPNFRNSVQGF